MGIVSFALGILFALFISFQAIAEDWKSMRRSMISEIADDVRATSAFIGKKRLDERVLQIMATVPRHEFVPAGLRKLAYLNRPLPIGYGQTISQPYIVAIMTDLLALDENTKVLEIGTGSAYQAAILSGLVTEVYTLEIIPELAESARKRLTNLGYDNVTVLQGDGYYGLEDKAPFDAIMVTASADHIPPPLIRQLKPKGRMIIPVGGPWMTQHLILIHKDSDGKVRTQNILPVMFVPLTGNH